MLSSVSNKAKLFAENFSKNSNLDDSGMSLPVFPSRTNLKLHNISVTPKMVKKVIMNLDLSRASGPDCIPVVVLKNCEAELSYILAELFNKCLKESYSQYGFRSSRSTADLLTVVSDRIARAFNSSGTTRAVALIYPRLLTGFGMLIFFTKLSLMEFQVRYLALFLLFSVIDDVQ